MIGCLIIYFTLLILTHSFHFLQKGTRAKCCLSSAPTSSVVNQVLLLFSEKHLRLLLLLRRSSLFVVHCSHELVSVLVLALPVLREEARPDVVLGIVRGARDSHLQALVLLGLHEGTGARR